MNKIVLTGFIFLCCGTAMAEQEILIVAKKKTDLEKIIIQVVSFRETSIDEAIDFAWARAIELDSTSANPKEKGVTILVQFASGETYPILEKTNQSNIGKIADIKFNYSAKNISLLTLLRELATQMKLDLYITSVGVVYCPPGRRPFPNRLASDGEIWEKLQNGNTPQSPSQ